ncbi:DUF2207 family protein [Nocardioides phosphati]|nr:DUF2207 domain-containing protein [Nocardioides phosphati]
MRGKQWGDGGVFGLTVAALLVALGLLVWPLLGALSADEDSGNDPAKVTDYRAETTVSSSGKLHTTEMITAELPAGRHGIFRYWDVADGVDPHGRAMPRNVKIEQDGKPAEVAWLWKQARQFRVARIGDAGTILDPGTHVWKIDYDVDGVLAKPGSRYRGGSWASDEGSEFVWDVVPWSEMQVDRAQVTVHLPSDPTSEPQCARSSGHCAVAVDGSTVTVTASDIAVHEPVSLAARLDGDPHPGVLLPWPAWLDAALGRSVPVALGLALLAVLAFAVGRLLERRTRERAPGFPVLFEPPAGIGPVQAAYIVREQLPKNAVSSTVLYLAERGFVKLDHQGQNRWSVTGLKTAADWQELDELSQHVGRSLGVNTESGSFIVDGSVHAGERLSKLSTSLPEHARDWAIGQGLLVKSPMVPGGRVALVVAAALALLCAWQQPFGVGLIALVPGLFVVGGIGLVQVAATTHRTATGRDLWSRAGGFRRMLATDSAEARFDFAARKDLYTAYIPYAVAFGCADAWARKYTATVGEPAPVPLWYAGGMVNSGYGGGYGTLSFDSFDAALGSSISAYSATQRSSSSGAGGGGGFSFSGGGGGGGGGMGSW